MSSVDLIFMGFKNLWRRKLRTFLTILGVIIGTTSIIVMVSLGIGVNEGFQYEISRMGSLNVINVYPGYQDFYMGGGGMYAVEWDSRERGDDRVPLDDAAVAQFAGMPGVEAVTPILETHLKFVSGRYQAYISVKGIVPEVMETFEYKVEEGRLLEESDTLQMVFGSQIPYTFYDERSMGRGFYGGFEQEALVDVLQDRMIMTGDMSYGERMPPGVPRENSRPPKTYKVSGVGILEGGNYENDYYAFMNINQLKRIMEEVEKEQQVEYGGNRRSRVNGSMTDEYQNVMVRVTDMNDVQDIQEQIKDMGFQAYSPVDYLESMKNASMQIQAVLGGIGAISLLVAALGITNTMIMSIYERTREIGVMKVIGASLGDIGRIFLLEAALIGFLGGGIGLGFSKLISFIINSVGGNMMGPDAPVSRISVIPFWLVIYALGFTTLVGIIAGFYPARRAMKLSALEAIRTE